METEITGLLTHQKKVVNYILQDQLRNKYLLLHSTGSGKTITALTAAFMFEYPIVIITTPSSIEQWYGMVEKVKSFLRKTDPTVDERKVTVVGYQYFYRNPLEVKICKDCFMIIDEFHHLRTPIELKKYHFNQKAYDEYLKLLPQDIVLKIQTENRYKNDNSKWINLNTYLVKFDIILDLSLKYYKKSEVVWLNYVASLKSKKLLILTATPIVNNKTDLDNLSLFLYRKKRFQDVELKEVRETFFYYNVFENGEYIKYFPKVVEQTLLLKSDFDKMKQIIKSAESDPSVTFLILANKLLARGVSTMSHYFKPKIDFIVKELNLYEKNHTVGERNYKNIYKKPQKIMIYSKWIERGIKIITEELEKSLKGVDVYTITGKTKKTLIPIFIERFNNNEEKTQIIILSNVGVEGLNLMGVRKVYLLDPAWSYAVQHQVISRAVRYKSHNHLPEKDRMVEIFHLLLKDTIDEYIVKNYITKKKELEEDFFNTIKGGLCIKL